MNLNFQWSVAALALAMCGTGCVYRTIIRVEDRPGINASLMETIDEVPWVSQTHQFWVCKEDPAAITCDRTCGAPSDLACHSVSVLGGNNLR
jgi:hypothetical protein